MAFLLALARLIDKLNEKISGWVSWALLAAVIICSGNALVRYTFNTSSNSWLEIQWYLFALMFLFSSGHTLRRDEHVRIDVVTGRFSRRTRVWLDLAGYLLFLLPVVALVLWYAVPYALLSIQNQEMSSNAGGLIVWPAKLLIPVAFLLLALQGLSELIKRAGFLMGLVDASQIEKHSTTPQEEIEAIKAANHLK